MQLRIKDNGLKQHGEILLRHMKDRITVELNDDGMLIELCINEMISKAESYQICETEEGWLISGADELGLHFGIGKFLHTAKWSEEQFVPKPPKGVVSPACTFRAIYFSVHFYNWYQNAPLDEMERYLEELLLWGYNIIVCILPIASMNSFDDKLYYNSAEKTRKIYALAKKIGMKTCIIISPNQGLISAPHEWDADPSFDPLGTVRGHAGRNLCLSKPGVMDYLRDIWIKQLKTYEDVGLDYVVTWPYDEGGCGCKDCGPWGANGFLRCTNEIHEMAKQIFPNSKIIVSTWIFDKPDDQGEYDGLYKHLGEDLDYVEYLLTDAHEDFPTYPLEHDVIKPIINFPEISMWKLYPWGGRGANPLPKRFQRLWNQAKHILSGGMPYSEGLYEDILKVQCIGYYWEPNKHYRDILAEYISYEYSADVCEEVLEMMELIEDNHVGVANSEEPNMEKASRVLELAEKVNEQLSDRARTSWRWRILYIRAVLDKMTFDYYYEHRDELENGLYYVRHMTGEFYYDNSKAQELLQELGRMYHCVSFNEENHSTLPPVKDGIII